MAKLPGDDDEDERDLNSPEAAGIIRGLSRSVRLLQRSVIGRLPRRKVSVKQVGRLSDRASLGLDLFTNLSESQADHKSSTSSARRAQLDQLGIFGKNLIKNTILGTAVFEAYEKISDKAHGSSYGEQFGNSLHFISGAAAGSVHSALTLIFEAAEFRMLPTVTYIVLNMAHHATAHSILFGSYISTKRFLENIAHGERSSGGINGGEFLMDYQVGITAVAGGISGVVQNSASHYTGMWLQVETTEKTLHHVNALSGLKESSSARSFANRFMPLPALRQNLMAFPGMAVAFLAFEYARDV